MHVVARRRLRKDILLGPLVIPFESLHPFSNREFDLPVSPAFQRPTLVPSISLPEALRHDVTATVGSTEVSVELNQVSDVPAGVIPGGLPEDSLEERTKAAATLNAADSAMFNTWELVLKNVKWVVDAVDKVAEVHPWAKMAWSVLSVIPKAFLAQVERDEGVKSFLVAIGDAFDLAESADTIRLRGLGTKQTTILKEMMHHICDCGDFIRGYAGDERFRDRLRKHFVGGTDEQIKRYGDRLRCLRGQFLDHSTVAIQNTAYRIQDDLSRVPGRLDGLAFRLEQIASEVVGVEMDAKLGEIPYPQGTRFRPDERCQLGTRVAFLDHITSWVNDPPSPRALVLFGQAGTGKSLAVSPRYSSYARTEPDAIPPLLFTGLVLDLADRYYVQSALVERHQKQHVPSARRTILLYVFQYMLLEPLREVPLIGPFFFIIDTLDESGDVSGTTGLHTFLASNIYKLPPNFRILITSRLEKDIVDAFDGADSLANIRMSDSTLSRTHEDIRAYIEEHLSPTAYLFCGERLAVEADGLLQ
ncbi:hypothetical protein BC834DRAFT_974825 [Gloeopeniophorella convolvens]|nr:hypothetical protein BC834DRAFT_974825 [Gloeopeniophorella convolvens]